MKVTVLAGGVGAARLLAGLVEVIDPASITVVANVADDLVIHGLHVSPDIDTVIYTVAGAIDPERGWGLAGETWQAMEGLRRYGGIDWFNLGDRDLATHLYRTQRLSEGASLGEVTAEIARAWGLDFRILPVTEGPLRTMVTVVDEGEIGFQEYFVRRRHDVAVTSVRFAGAEATHPGPGVIDAIADADVVVVAPSNPIVSIGPLLAVPDVRDAVVARRESVIAVSPIVAGSALKGPADRMLAELGYEASVIGVAGLYAEIAGTLVIDQADARHAADIEALGIRCLVRPTIMSEPGVRSSLARAVLGLEN